MNLHNRDQLRGTVQGVTQTIFPERPFDASVFTALPSGPTLSRAQVLLDAGLCCYTQTQFASQDCLLYLLADSSPQAGSDYLLSTALMIARDDLEACAHAAQYTRMSWDAFVDAYKRDDKTATQKIVLERHAHGRTLNSLIKVRRFMPMALG